MKKRYFISIIIIWTTLITAYPAFCQNEDQQDRQSREGLRRFRELPSDGRARLRAVPRSFGREAQLKIIEDIEERLATLKTAIKEGPDRQDFRKLREARPEEQVKFRKEWQKARQQQQKTINVIQEQLTTLAGPRPQRPDLAFTELRAIHELALKENAKRTAERIEKLIAKYHRDPNSWLQRAERPKRTGEQQTQSEESVSGKKAPELTLTSFDGTTMSLSGYKGKIVVLEWFNNECPFVQYHYDTTTTMVDLAKKYKDKNVVWFAVNSTSHTTEEVNKTFAEEHKLPYLILDDRSGKVGRAYNATNTPQIFIIDPSGNIVYEGAIDNSPMGKTPQNQEQINYVDKALAELTDGKAVSIKESKPYGCTVKYAN
jgi:peroxiredoxin